MRPLLLVAVLAILAGAWDLHGLWTRLASPPPPLGPREVAVPRLPAGPPGDPDPRPEYGPLWPVGTGNPSRGRAEASGPAGAGASRESEPQPQAQPRLRVRGVWDRAGERGAVVEAAGESGWVRVAPGDRVGAYRVVEITPWGVRFADETGREFEERVFPREER
ncbi:hypothetical protein [Deferrisoma palaeochoriense]